MVSRKRPDSDDMQRDSSMIILRAISPINKLIALVVIQSFYLWIAHAARRITSCNGITFINCNLTLFQIAASVAMIFFTGFCDIHRITGAGRSFLNSFGAGRCSGRRIAAGASSR